MEQPFSTSKVTVEYFDPHGVYKLLEPGLIPRLPLRDLHWQSHAGPTRSISTLHVDLLSAGTDPFSVASPLGPTSPLPSSSSDLTSRDDGFTTQSVAGGRATSSEHFDSISSTLRAGGKERRHQIPGLRRTPYLKVLFIRCDDPDTYKAQTRAEIREWIKEHTPPAQSTRKVSGQENHDAFEWLVVHVVIPNTVAATQPRTTGSKGSEGSTADTSKSSGTSRWRGGSSTLLEKLRSDFNGTSKSAVDRVAQIRIGINDVPYDILPRVVPAAPSGYVETEHESETAWLDLIGKFKSLILSSFDMRVSQYEEDIKEKDSQRSIPGWNFCTFFILKEGLARGFESVGLVEDALVGYDELSVGLDTTIEEQSAPDPASARTGALLGYTQALKQQAQKVVAAISNGSLEIEDEEAVDLQSRDNTPLDQLDDIPISATKKPYREMILASNVSLFDFRCYIFARQIALLLRLGNAWSTREELLAKLKEHQESVPYGVAPRAPPPKPTDEAENLSRLAEICKRTLEFIPAVSQVMRRDLIAAMCESSKSQEPPSNRVYDPVVAEAADNLVASFAYSVAQQILAQTSSKALPIPPSTLGPPESSEPKASIPEPKTMMHPARSSSLHVRSNDRQPPSPGIFPGPGARGTGASDSDGLNTQFLKVGLEELAARRAELYTLSRNILEECGKKRGWSDGWALVPIVGHSGIAELEDVDLSDSPPPTTNDSKPRSDDLLVSAAGIDNQLLRTALDNKNDFYRLYETLTDKALRHYTVAGHTHSLQANMADLAILKYHLQEYGAAASFFYRTTPFFGESGWSLLELSMLVMYSRCLRELHRQDKYVQVVIKLLSKAAAAERDRMQYQSSFRPGPKTAAQYPDSSAITGFLDDLLAVSKGLPNEVCIPLINFFSNLEIDGCPEYDDHQDSFSLHIRIHSFLQDDLEISSAKARMTSPAGGSTREIWLESRDSITLKPGRNGIRLRSNVIVPGSYDIDLIKLLSSNVCMHHERDPAQPSAPGLPMLTKPRVTLYQRSGSLDVRLAAAKNIQLDKNSSLDLELSTGWNEITSCEIRVRSATGGLRLLMSEAKILTSLDHDAKHPEGGLFTFKSISRGSSAKIRFPFTVEQEVASVAVKVEVLYTTDAGSFTFSKTPSVAIALALGVNVQDVFKHSALFSRFTVSTASSSPLRLFKSELLSSDVFESHFGVPPSDPVMIFPKQPASLLYKITRKLGIKLGADVQKTMYLRLYYSVLQDEIENLIEKSIAEALNKTPLSEYSRLVIAHVHNELQHGLVSYDLERAALLGELSTSILTEVTWEKYFVGLGKKPGETGNVAAELASFILGWQKEHSHLSIPEPDPTTEEPRSILIPVDIPSLTVVHTADIRLQEPLASLVSSSPAAFDSGTPTVCLNQLVPATLHLKWTRVWDTDDVGPGKATTRATGEDLEFSYEVTAPTDTWLLGGRRKGHFVIPAAADHETGLSSTPDTEADIQLLLVPLREGWLPYPAVEIREVRSSSTTTEAEGGTAAVGAGALGHCETDSRNLGETLRVVADRARVTLSLDASGPGGGPLVLECEPWARHGGRVVV